MVYQEQKRIYYNHDIGTVNCRFIDELYLN